MYTPIIGYISLYDMMYYFFIYAFLGWTAEVIFAALKNGKFVNRGFLNGPVCPIYGVGMAILVLLLNPLKNSWWLLFIAGAVFCSLLELVTGFVLDKIFKTKWWDYSNEKLNLKGYICIRFTILWGLAVVLLFNTLVPLTDKIISIIPQRLGIILLIVFWVVFIVDLITDVIELKVLDKDLKEIDKIAKGIHKNSDKIGIKISDATLTVNKRLIELGEKIKKSRLGRAFPFINKKHETALNELAEQLKKAEEVNAKAGITAISTKREEANLSGSAPDEKESKDSDSGESLA